MAITPQQILTAKQVQDTAAQDTNQTVRLVAGPGTGKSFVIEGRVHWLLSNQNIPPEDIIAISFTRAASKDLKERIHGYCLTHNQPNVTNVRVSTLHSLALYILRKTGNLNLYPKDPIIMDDWELSEIFDAEYGHSNSANPTRCGEIRRDHEAFWSTGNWNPPNLPVPKKAITAAERQSFTAFYSPRTQAYSCVLPGEIIRMCVTQIQAGLIDPVAELGVQHLIVDEVQDLNPCDFDFIDLLIQRGVNVFISGDDDQSVYSFRYAFPQGIQNFTTTYPNSTNHVLADCFRCTPAVLNAAIGVINTFPAQNRIPKNLGSLYSNSNPINNGFLQANTFISPQREASYIANSCQALINQNFSPKDIMILVSNKRAQLNFITDALDDLNIGYDANQREDFKDSNHGRFLISILRILENTNDYIAHRVLLGTPNGIGLTTCNGITDKVIANNMNYRTVFYNQLPTGVFRNREVAAIDKAKATLQVIQNWNLTETINQRTIDIDQIILTNFSQAEVINWRAFIASLPLDMTLDEFKDYLETDSQETKDNILNSIFVRLNQVNPQLNPMPDKIRIMSLHSSKGLSAKVVFIPGLEETIFPNTFAQQIPGLVLECARLFYVAITRAKAACIISHTRWRNLYGTLTQMTPSRYSASTGAVFGQQNNPALTTAEIQTIQTSIANL
ncbi:MAG: ATP-dependent helicase [Saprospiraceae bacterium]|nr:ATP-dependent helicase [Saprospiraceae bacterium]